MKLHKLLITVALILAPSLASAQLTCTVRGISGRTIRQYCDSVAGLKVGTVTTVTPNSAPSPSNTLKPLPGMGTLQSAITQAQTLAKTAPTFVVLSAGDYIGNVLVTRTSAPFPITITADPSLLPAAGVQVQPTATLPHIVPGFPGTTTVIIQGDNITLRGLNVLPPAVGVTSIDFDATMNPRPTNITLDQMVIRGDTVTGGHRGVGANAINFTITNSWIDRMWEVGRDSQAIAVWDTPGPGRIENNYLEAGSENILFGGSIPTCGCVPTDIVVTRNTMTKDLAWRTMSPSPQIKNILEIKFGRRITITDNDMSKNWPQAQTGWSVLINTMGVEGTAWTVIDTVTFLRNKVHDISSGLNIAAVSGSVSHLSIHDNIWQNIDDTVWGGDGRWAMVQCGQVATKTVSDVSITHETVINSTGNQFLGLYYQPCMGFKMTHVIVEHLKYGLFTSDGLGSAGFHIHAPDGVFVDNAIVGPTKDADGNVYASWLNIPTGNFSFDIPIRDQFDANGRVLATSPLANVATSDGQKVGAQP